MKIATRRPVPPVVLTAAAITVFAAAVLLGLGGAGLFRAQLNATSEDVSGEIRQAGDSPGAATTAAEIGDTTAGIPAREPAANSVADHGGVAHPGAVGAGPLFPGPGATTGLRDPSENSAALARLLDTIGVVGPDDRTWAAEAFVAAAAGSDMDDVMAAALPALNDRDPEIRYYSLVGLGASALAAPENAEDLVLAVPHLVAGLADGDALVREAAAAAIAAVQPAPPPWTAAALTEALLDPDARVASAAQAALALVGPADDYIAEAVSVDLYADDAMRRSRAVRTLGAVAGDTDMGLSALIWALGDSDPAVRWQAATALGEVGPAALEATYELAGIARDSGEDPSVRNAANTTLNSVME